MNFRNDNRFLFGLICLSFVLTSCSAATFPEIVEEDDVTSQESNFNLPPQKKVLKESKSLGTDERHAAYDGQKASRPAAKVVSGEKIASAKVKPVVKTDLKPSGAAKKTSGKKDGIEKIQDENFKKMFKPEEKNSNETEDMSPSVTYRLETFYFDDGSAVLDSGYLPRIREIVKQAKNKKALISVYGYASSRTRNTDVISHKLANFKVSSARAENVAAALRRAGLPANKIRVEALSDSNPAYLEVMPEGERLNRRAEVYISY